LDRTALSDDIRISYDPEPDFTRPPLEIPGGVRDRILKRLTFLYDGKTAQAWYPELERILKVHHAHKPSEMSDLEKNYDSTERFTQKDMVLITYGDLIEGEQHNPLASLAYFVERPQLRGIFNTIHILPFFPYSSDRGFSVTNFRKVDPKLGSWKEIAEIGKRYHLMFDGVLNHISARSRAFREFLNGNPYFRDMVVHYDSPDALTPEQIQLIRRPRTSDLLTKFESIDGPIWVWTTFSPDQVDLNYQNPLVLMQIMDILLLYIRNGADVMRLDAVTYLWEEPGTTGASLEQTHEILKLIRDVVDLVAPGVALLTETNVPHEENISYFGDGTDEAHMVYNFALPPLVLHTFYSKDVTALSNWARDLEYPTSKTTYLNILDTHDGVGVMGVRDILTEDQIQELIRKAVDNNALISYRSSREGSEKPYEINTTWWGALNNPDSGEDLQVQIRRFVASRCIPFLIKGVPAIYFVGLGAVPNDPSVAETTDSKRDINRHPLSESQINEDLTDPASPLSLIRESLGHIALIRIKERAFHPGGEHRILSISPQVFTVLRTSPEADERILCLINVSDEPQNIDIPESDLEERTTGWMDLVGGKGYGNEEDFLSMELEPYQVMFLKAKE
jgi:sucrose phosphorylase